MATVTPPANKAEIKKAPPTLKKGNGEDKSVKKTAILAKVVEKTPQVITRIPVKGLKIVPGVKYWDGSGNPPCMRHHQEDVEACQICGIRAACQSATQAKNKTAMVSHISHPKTSTLKNKKDVEAAFQDIRAVIQEGVGATTLRVAERIVKLYLALDKDTFAAECERHLGWKYQRALKFVNVFEWFSPLEAEAPKLLENLGSQENIFIATRSENPIELARKGTITFKDAEGKTKTAKISDMGRREFEAALKATPGTKTRKSRTSIKPEESKAQPMPIVRRIAKPMIEHLATVDEVVKKTKTISHDDLREVKAGLEKGKKFLSILEVLASKAASAPTKASKPVAKSDETDDENDD